jgi:hypothetical protein
VQIVSNFKQNRIYILTNKSFLQWLFFICLVAISGCGKEDEGKDDFFKPLVQEFNVAVSSYNLMVTIEVSRADQAEISVSDAFGNSARSKVLNLNAEGESLEFSFDLKAENFVEGQVTVVAKLNNDRGATNETETIQFLPFGSSQYAVLLEQINGSLKVFSLDSAGGKHVQMIMGEANMELLYVSSSHNPLLLYNASGQLSSKRLYDSLEAEPVGFVPFRGEVLPAIETEEEVFIPFTSGEYCVMPRNLGKFFLVSPTFHGELIEAFMHKEYLIMLYSVGNKKFFEIKNAQSHLLVKQVEQYAFDYAFSTGNDLVFVRESEGGFYNYTAYDIEKKEFDILGNSEKFEALEYISHGNQFSFLGNANGVSGLFTIDGFGLRPRLSKSFVLGNEFFSAHKSLFASGVLAYPSSGGYSVEATRSSGFPVNVDVVLSADDLVNARSIYLLPY